MCVKGATGQQPGIDRTNPDIAIAHSDQEKRAASFSGPSGQSWAVRKVRQSGQGNVASPSVPSDSLAPQPRDADSPPITDEEPPSLRNGRVKIKAGGSTGKSAVIGAVLVPGAVAASAAIAGAILQVSAGAVIGQMAIPIPGVGAVVGAVITGALLAVGGGALAAGIDRLRGGKSQQKHLDAAVKSLLERGHDLADEDAQRLTSISRRQWNKLLHIKTERKWMGRSGKGYVTGEEDRQVIREAIVLTAAKHGYEAAKAVKAQLGAKPGDIQANAARKIVSDLAAAPPKEPHHYYNPFRKGQDYKLQGNRARFENKLHFDTLDSAAGKRPLKDVDPNHVLVIDGHGGNRKRGKIVNMTQLTDNTEFLTAEQLADRLIEDGLSRDHKVIRMSNCFAGGLRLRADSNGNYHASLRRNQQEQGVCFASQLAQALGRRGFDNIVVGGYPGTVHVANVDDPVQIEVIGIGVRHIRATGLANYFDSNGQLTDNPRNPDKHLTNDEKDQLIKERMR
jgi:hypothetical protein